MGLQQTLRFMISAALVIAVGGCSSPKLIGAPNALLMGPSEGLVVGSLSYTTSTPNFMHYRFFHYVSDFESLDAQKTDFSLGTIDRVQIHVFKAPRNPEETAPVLMIFPAKAGRYRLKQTQFSGEDRHFTFWPDSSTKEFEVISGQITYVGNTVAYYVAEFRGIGVLTPVALRPILRDEFEGDMAELRAVEKRLESVTAINMVTK